MCYAQDFLETWSGCDFIVGTSFGVPIKRGIVVAIGADTPIAKVKRRKLSRKRLSKPSLKRVLRVLRLALRPIRERLRNLMSS